MGKKKRHSRRGGFTLPLAIVAPVALQALAIGKLAMSGGVGQAKAIECITGVYPGHTDFNWQAFFGTYGPIAAGVGVHYLAKVTGLNRALGRAKVPFIRF